MKTILLFLIMNVLLISCVSVSISPNKSHKAQDVKFENPKHPFKKIEAENADFAWQSQKTGNTMAFISECNGSDQSLQNLEKEALSALNSPRILKSQNIEYAERAALESLIEGQVDGITVQLWQILFKKNGCNFIISYVGRKTNFSKEIEQFEIWKKTVRVP